MLFGHVRSDQRVTFSHVQRRCGSRLSFVFQRFYRLYDHVCYYSQEGTSRGSFFDDRLAANTSNVIVSCLPSLICCNYVVDFEGGPNAGPLCLIQAKDSAKRRQQVSELCNGSSCNEVVLLWDDPCPTCDASHSRSNCGSVRLSVNVSPSLLAHDASVSYEIDQVFRLLRSGESKDNDPRFLNFNSNSFRSIHSQDGRGLHSRYFRRVPTFRTRHVKRNRCRFMAFNDYRGYRTSAYVSANQLGGDDTKLRHPFNFNVFGRDRESAIFRTPYQIRVFRFYRCADLRPVAYVMVARFRWQNIARWVYRFLYCLSRVYLFDVCLFVGGVAGMIRV